VIFVFGNVCPQRKQEQHYGVTLTIYLTYHVLSIKPLGVLLFYSSQALLRGIIDRGGLIERIPYVLCKLIYYYY
jgi:hypothetical protein